MRHMKKLMLSVLLFTAAALPVVAQPSTGGADTATLVVPYAASGTADVVARRLAEVIRRQAGTVLVIVNQGGAGGTIGAAKVARAKPDGRTLLLASTSVITIGPHLYPVKYDALKDLTPLLSIAVAPVAIVASRSAPFKDMAGALAYARANTGAVRYATPGVGSVAHLAMEGLALRAGVKMTHVPYRGESPAINDALGGVVELLVVNTPTLLPHVQAGSLRPLAVLEANRLPVWPNVPTLAEVGFDGMNYSSNFGVFAPTGLNKDMVDKLTEIYTRASKSPEFRSLLELQALLPGNAVGKDYERQINAEHEQNGKIIKSINIVAN